MIDLYLDTLIRVRAEPVEDVYGNPDAHRDWAGASRTLISRMSVQPGEMMEEVGNRPFVTSTARAYSAPGNIPDFKPTDRAEWNGAEWEIHGDIRIYSIRGGPHHVEFNLRRVAG